MNRLVKVLTSVLTRLGLLKDDLDSGVSEGKRVHQC